MYAQPGGLNLDSLGVNPRMAQGIMGLVPAALAAGTLWRDHRRSVKRKAKKQYLRGSMDAPRSKRSRIPIRRARRVVWPKSYRSRRGYRRRGTIMRRRSRRGYRRRRGFKTIWSRRDIWRTSDKLTFGALVDQTAANAYPGSCQQCTLHHNPNQFIDALGAHGAFDITGIDGPPFGGTAALTNANTNFRLRCFNNNNGHQIRVIRPTFKIKWAPDWQLQGTADTDAGVFSSVSKMVIHCYCITTKDRLSFNKTVTAGNDFAGQFGLINHAAAGGALADGTEGWLQYWANGLTKRMGNVTTWTDAATPVKQFLSTDTVAGRILTSLSIPFLGQDGVSLYDSPDLLRSFRVRRIKSTVITPGDTRVTSYVMPSYTIDTNALETPQLPPVSSNFNATTMPFVPKGYSFLYFRAQVYSNQADLVGRPAVAFDAQVIFNAHSKVKNSTMGGNLYLRPTFKSVGNRGLLPANPERDPNALNNDP